MRGSLPNPTKKTLLNALAAMLILAVSSWAQQAPATSAEHESKDAPVVRTFGTEGGYRTEVKSETRGTLSQEDQRQVSLLAAQVFQHVDEASRALDAENAKRARGEIDKGREAIEAIRALLPTTTVHTRTTAPDGKVIYEDRREVQQDRVSLFEGMLHARTLAPIVAARRDASEVAGVRVVESETISTEVMADLDLVEAQLKKAARAIDDKKSEDASRALAQAQVRGVDFRYSKEDTPLAEARDAIWLARRALEENNSTQAQANLAIARQRLEVFRQVLPENRRQEVTQMLTEVGKLESQLRQEANQAANHDERSSQGAPSPAGGIRSTAGSRSDSDLIRLRLGFTSATIRSSPVATGRGNVPALRLRLRLRPHLRLRGAGGHLNEPRHEIDAHLPVRAETARPGARAPARAARGHQR